VVAKFEVSLLALALVVAMPKSENAEMASMMPKLTVKSTSRPLRVNLMGETATGVRVDI
jgi:hypothetical protein